MMSNNKSHPFLADPRRPLCCLDCGDCEASHSVNKSQVTVPNDEELLQLVYVIVMAAQPGSPKFTYVALKILQKVRDRTREATLRECTPESEWVEIMRSPVPNKTDEPAELSEETLKEWFAKWYELTPIQGKTLIDALRATRQELVWTQKELVHASERNVELEQQLGTAL